MTSICNILVIIILISKSISKMSRITLLLLVSTLMIQCKSKDYMTPYEYDGRTITFGGGGGFTGKVAGYTLMENGQIFQGTNLEGNVTALKKISKDKVEQCFNNYDQLGLSNLNIDSPGNMYKYVTMKQGDKTHKITWGSAEANESKELRVFHANLMSLVGKVLPKNPQKIQIK